LLCSRLFLCFGAGGVRVFLKQLLQQGDGGCIRLAAFRQRLEPGRLKLRQAGPENLLPGTLFFLGEFLQPFDLLDPVRLEEVAGEGARFGVGPVLPILVVDLQPAPAGGRHSPGRVIGAQMVQGEVRFQLQDRPHPVVAAAAAGGKRQGVADLGFRQDAHEVADQLVLLGEDGARQLMGHHLRGALGAVHPDDADPPACLLVPIEHTGVKIPARGIEDHPDLAETLQARVRRPEGQDPVERFLGLAGQSFELLGRKPARAVTHAEVSGFQRLVRWQGRGLCQSDRQQ